MKTCFDEPDMYCPDIPGPKGINNFYSKSCEIKQRDPMLKETCYPQCFILRKQKAKTLKFSQLTKEILAEIGEKLINKKETQEVIAKQFHISMTMLYRIKQLAKDIYLEECNH